VVRNEEMQCWLDEFHKTFGEFVPLMQVGYFENEELIDAIRKSIEEGKNLLPEIFNFSDDPNILE